MRQPLRLPHPILRHRRLQLFLMTRTQLMLHYRQQILDPCYWEYLVYNSFRRHRQQCRL